MEQRIGNIEKIITMLSTDLKSISESMSAGFQKVQNNFEIMKKEVDTIHKKLDNLTKKVEFLEGSTNDGFDGVGVKLESLSEEIAKIGTVTKYEEEYLNLKGLKN